MMIYARVQMRTLKDKLEIQIQIETVGNIYK